ncbi:MAG TPA: FAD-dependent oxidoreductase [Candidatus Polarisedimenticolia bacterium]|nr:FAD-dependent oxidoreductase [Candidatus Polarisedimenticolia bacterium]
MSSRRVSRRSLLKSAAALFALNASRRVSPLIAATHAGMRVAVVGAGAFGGWTALHLLGRGARVVVLDSWGPGNSRASSGGETRVIRATYGPDRIYVEMVARSLRLWREAEKRFSRPLFMKTGVIWMAGQDDRYERAALPLLRAAGLAVEEMSLARAATLYPQVNFEGVAWVLHEKEAGYLLARRACQAVLERFLAEGGTYRQVEVKPGPIVRESMGPLRLSDGATLAADRYVFACGPWLGALFPEVIGDRIRPTRQEVFFFGTPPGDATFLEDRLPVWIDNGPRIFYGIPGSEWRGFKVADDTHGPTFDPTSGERVPSARRRRAARDYLAFRFPGLRDAPLLEARVCQYENSPDSRFIIDRHPEARNAFFAGGGSGHGFKHGPALGERVADMVLGERRPDPFFSLSRFGTDRL